jgi:hypothetical protein
MNVQTDALARAIDYLGATNLGNGRYALHMVEAYPNVNGRWYTFGEKALLTAQIGKLAAMERVPMPSWWTPTQQFAVIATVPPRTVFGTANCKQNIPEAWLADDIRAICVTVDLTTGKEIPA